MRNESLAVRAGIGLMLLTAVVVLSAAGKQILYDSMDPDAFWHMRVAEQLLRDGVGPLVDELSFASRKEPWTPYSWLAELFMRQVWEAGGYRAAVLVQALSTAAILTFVTLAALAAHPSSRWAVVLACFVAAFLALPFLSFRPVTMCFVILAASRWLIERDRRPWWIVPLCVIGSNVHFFIWLVPAWVGCKLIDTWRGGEMKRIDLLFFGSILAACCCTPMLPGVVAQMIEYQFGDVMVGAAIIAEFQPLWLGTMGQIATGLVAAVVLLAAARAIANRQRNSPAHRDDERPTAPATLSLGEWLMLLVATALVLKMSRFAPVFAITAAPMLARILPKISDRVIDARPIQVGLAIFVTLLAARVAWDFPRANLPFDAWVNRHLPEGGGYPVAAAAFVESHVRPEHGKLLNEFTWGGYLGWRLDGAFQTLLDERTQLFERGFWETMYLQDDAARASYLRGVKADAAVLPARRSVLTGVLEQLGWRRIYTDERAIVMVPPDSLLAQTRLPTD